MKKKDYFWSLLAILMSVTLSVSFLSCSSDDDEEPAPELSIGQFDISLDAKEGSGSISVTANHTDWGAEVTQGTNWLTANKNGNSVFIKANENTATEVRKGQVKITATADANLTYTITVTQLGTASSILINGLTESSLTFEGDFDGKSGIDFKQTVNVVSNVTWTLSGIPDWLSVSPTNGNGTVPMDIYPRSQNETSSSRSATIVLSGAGVSATINIIQSAGKPVCYVEPSNIVALYNRIAWDYQATSNVNKFHYILLSEREFNRMTDKEMIEELSKEEELKFSDDYIIMRGSDSHNYSIVSNSTYYIVTLAYDTDNKAGELKKVEVKTPTYLNADNDAWVNFSNIQCNYLTGFRFDATKEGYCNTYHLIYGVLPAEYNYNSAIYAFEINYYLKNKKKHWFAENWEMEIVTDYPNNHTFTYSTSYLTILPRCVAYGWGVFKDGALSSDLVGFQWDTSSSSARQISASRGNSNEVENQIIRRSVERDRARKSRLQSRQAC